MLFSKQISLTKITYL